MKNVVERIEALPPTQQAILLQRLKQKVHQPVTNPSLVLAPSDRWTVRYRQNTLASMRLFCFSYAGGGASVFRSWPDALPPYVEMYAVQLPGRENRLGEAAYTRIAPLVENLAAALLPYLDKPFAFFGHSMGALVSFELARHLRKTHNRHPMALYLAAYRAPQLPNPNISIYHLPSEVFKVVLRAEGISETILQNEELMRAMLPTLRADFELCDTYKYREEAPLDCPLRIFGGLEDIRISATDLEGWSVHTNSTYQLCMLPGSHFFLHSAQDRLIAKIAEDLEIQSNASARLEFVREQAHERRTTIYA